MRVPWASPAIRGEEAYTDTFPWAVPLAFNRFAGQWVIQISFWETANVVYFSF